MARHIGLPRVINKGENMEFYVGQIFINEYPPEAAIWCNETGENYIAEIEPDELGRTRYQIKSMAEDLSSYGDDE